MSVRKRIGAGLLALMIFAAGWGFGSGRLSLSPKRIAEVVANQSVGSIPSDGLQEVYESLVRNYDGDIDTEKILDGLKRGAVSAAEDPYTEYFSPEEAKAFNEELDGTFEGIGAELSKEGATIVVVSPIKGAPAEKAGVRARDAIVQIDGESATDMTVSEAVKRIRGEKGTTVKLTIIRGTEQLELSIVRDTIDIPSVEWRVDGDTGIISIGRFSDDTTSLVRKAASEFESKNIGKVVLDLRGNPGGLLDQAVGVSSVWLNRDTTVLEEKTGGETTKTFTSNADPILDGVKTVILIDEGSASASEIVAGALHDQGVATLVGKKSFGKGSVQQLIELDNGGALKVTIARWYTPKGKNIDKEGIAPDKEVARTADDITANRDPQLDAAKASF